MYLETFQTISGIIDNVGRGWDDNKIARFFDESNKVGYGQQEVPMTISKHYEHAYILLSTMTKNQIDNKERQRTFFTIECYMPSFEPQNITVCIQHAGMFKHDTYTFHPQKDLVLSMPYDFVINLKPGQFTSLDNLWLKSVKKILQKAKTNSIKQIRLVRLPKKHFIGSQTMTFKNFNEDVMYEAFTDSKNSSFLVSLDQIDDIVGGED